MHYYGMSSYNDIEIGDLVVLVNSQAEPYTVVAMYPGGMVECQGQSGSYKYQASALMTIKRHNETLLASVNKRCAGVERYVEKALTVQEELERQRKEYIDSLNRNESEWQRRLGAAKGEMAVLEQIIRVSRMRSVFSRNLGNVGEFSGADLDAKLVKAKKDVEKITEVLNFIHMRVVRARY
ncbi:hypothetical protein ACL9RI_05215 [Janthinobacterium sp. Mn2066]|uniref:hypothetical protein n=1 Tax=Janthinobacterium sp. Mn2066 TaxID=3395264 RepID=UPI003BBB0107